MGPLNGMTVIELGGIGPGPMAGMMLADMGAEVIRVERSLDLPRFQRRDASFRGKKSVVIDLKSAPGVEVLLRLLERADVMIDPYRPGVLERVGLAPDVCLARNPRLVYGRITGWGQQGPLARAAGHDINYVALTGALHAIGRAGEPPVPPLNLLGDMGGGGMLLAFGIVCALLESRISGRGQVIDAAMIDGAALLMWMVHSLQAAGLWNGKQRGVNLLDGGAPFYDTYQTSDGKHIAIGALEPRFYAELIGRIGADRAQFANPDDRSRWPELKAQLARVFKTRTRDEWCQVLEGTDACFAPVLSILEAPEHPHHRARGTYTSIDGFAQPAPAPRFSRTAGEIRHGQRRPGADGHDVLASAGFSRDEIIALHETNVVQGMVIPRVP
jgi:alpha-methylacyl-CoA racemase